MPASSSPAEQTEENTRLGAFLAGREIYSAGSPAIDASSALGRTQPDNIARLPGSVTARVV